MTVAVEMELTPEQNAVVQRHADFIGCTPEIALEIALTEFLHGEFSAPPLAAVYQLREEQEEGDHGNPA